MWADRVYPPQDISTSARSWKYLVGGIRGLPTYGFNGATSARSWKLTPTECDGSKLRSFNGATSARSWKWNYGPTSGVGRPASMGPRARARGNHSSAVGPPVVALLQWGHERALVEIKGDSTQRTPTGLLQWGH